MNVTPAIGIIILAAGASTRLGRPKQLLDFQGETLIQKVIKTALETPCRPIVVVLGAYYNEIKLEIEKLRNDEIIITKNNDWQQGMSTSIKLGLKILLHFNPDINAALFLLSDQPLLTNGYLQKLITHDASSIISSHYNHHAGVPALFNKKWFSELMQLTGDQGARKLLLSQADEVHAIPFPEGAFDIDTSENYEFLKQHFE